ncbi:carbamoyl phosphate synthase small subunit [Bacillus sp. HMF5848]|uniref:carbamoyl phosphate synthase small subunit n=1 Tax=Bacillus sp. HMF5848 TaxID=2495421 RepID=UPI000F78EC30|nr:carbamoyl phosphate synthase small subunit [Bacillus sp. HMF5848]RSK26452.1 carbamoyl phosphate synthase small subunit [Bacillus sp. HMF5848]
MQAYIHLQTGESFTGEISPSLSENVTGELVFYTGMTGYQEVLTDPSYKNQIVVFTYPLIGNYGINATDFESKKPHVAGVVVRQSFDSFYHYEAKQSLRDYLQAWNIPLLEHVDTRAVVKKIRHAGTMAATISTRNDVTSPMNQLIASPVSQVSEPAIKTMGIGRTHIVMIDFGMKSSIAEELMKRDCRITVVPYNTDADKIVALAPDGIVLSNGPGDPKQLQMQVPVLAKLLTKYPTLAICLGHQLVALAFGGNTIKLRFGHRGANHPVKDVITGKVFMTSQNHSYVVDENSLVNTPLSVRYRHVNDGTVEGLMHKSLPIMTVQHHPEAHPGPAECAYVFDDFLQLIQSVRRKAYA